MPNATTRQLKFLMALKAAAGAWRRGIAGETVKRHTGSEVTALIVAATGPVETKLVDLLPDF